MGSAPFAPFHRRVLWVLVALYALCWALAVVGISRDMRLPIDERFATSALLGLEGGIAFYWIGAHYSWVRGAWIALVVLSLAFAIEFLGVTTGLPFGRYHYTDALLPMIAGRVPAPITLAWLTTVLGSLAVARASVRGLVARVLLAAALASALDACIEPVAVHVKFYWIWEVSGPYYGVPLVNFIGWFVSAVLVIASAQLMLPEPNGAPWTIPVLLFWSNVAMFGIIDFFRGYSGGAVIGLALGLVLAIAHIWRAKRTRYFPPGMSDPSTPDSHEGSTGSSCRE